ncbi:DUF4124 domain-containing protein [Shewanella sp. VB17]|uniref:DUF4124 domain-containing protein n=1 Tax=Shewanella sp. VB17 TaxID=2739432 RepID=UPI001566AF0C|nr:DUF4124 domain-containing protein [Shewanella sp. VB17]NRD72553.1 DUF4124 domain-containing protein [Shewanella sp. VB17]
MIKKITLICFSFFVIQSAAATIIYKWVDKNGVVHYSQQQPENIHSNRIYSEDIEQAPIGFIPPKVRKQTTRVQSEDEKNADIIKQKNTKQADAICESAQQKLNILSSHSRLKSKNATTGEIVSMNEEDRQTQIKDQKKRIELFCSK